MSCGDESFGITYKFSDDTRKEICGIEVLIKKTDKHNEDILILLRSQTDVVENLSDNNEGIFTIKFKLSAFEGVTEPIPTGDIINKTLTEKAKNVIKAALDPENVKTILDRNAVNSSNISTETLSGTDTDADDEIFEKFSGGRKSRRRRGRRTRGGTIMSELGTAYRNNMDTMTGGSRRRRRGRRTKRRGSRRR